MTRHKKEIMKRLYEIELQIEDGYLHAGWLDALYSEAEKLQEELAHLMHYDSYMAYLMDERWVQLAMNDPNVLFV